MPFTNEWHEQYKNEDMKEKTILCYGDSNTWGFVPGSYVKETDFVERFSRGERWPNILQALLDDSYEVISEGLNGRTTNIDDPDMCSRNGLSSLQMILDTHEPLDLVILLLGANDCKVHLSRTAEDISKGIDELCEIISKSVCGVDLMSAPKIVLVTYPLPPHENGFEGGFLGAIDKIKQLNQYILSICEQNDYLLFDAASYISLSTEDGIHLDAEGHQLLAQKLYDLISR